MSFELAELGDQVLHRHADERRNTDSQGIAAVEA
jgi:hypothetical protein